MASSVQTETKADNPLSSSLLNSFKTKDQCPRCKENFLRTMDTSYALRERRYIKVNRAGDDEKKLQSSLAADAAQAAASEAASRESIAPFEEIMRNVCLRCGYSFDENEQMKELRKEGEKAGKEKNPWDAGLLVLLSMLAVILVINLDRGRLDNRGDNQLREDRIEQPRPAATGDRDGLF